MSRRQFLGLAAAAAGGALIAPGIHLIEVARAADASTAGSPAGAAPPRSGANPKVRWGLLIDTTRCAPGCNDCVNACNRENGLGATAPSPSRTAVQWIRKVEIKDIRTGRAASVPVMCQHCTEPPCVDVCPTGASFKRADGIVLVDRHSCIGCRYCMMACPYKARSFVHETVTDQQPDVPRGKGCVEGCTLCVHRIDRGEGITACAEACAKAGHEAIVFGDLNDPQSSISKRLREIQSRQLRADLGLDPGVRYHGV
ncbi:MAG: hypothetical protein RLZZ584_2842 [Pseudomonadota bacterium]|jgi:molybdopterin-containing oxidoreductase family iron-sulfur binding subunit